MRCGISQISALGFQTGPRKAHNVTPVVELDFVILEITKRFRDFLAAGLATVDDATWP